MAELELTVPLEVGHTLCPSYGWLGAGRGRTQFCTQSSKPISRKPAQMFRCSRSGLLRSLAARMLTKAKGFGVKA